MIDRAQSDAFKAWHDDPVIFARQVFKAELDAWQIDALRALTTRDRVAFIASKGVGKSYLEAVSGWWWMCTRLRAQVICTSINANNLRSGLWKEIGGLYHDNDLLQHLFQFNSERVVAREDPTNWFMEARSWRDHVDPVEQAQALAGLHGPAMLWLGDEAGSYGEAIISSGSAMLANVVAGSGREGKMLLGGNPTDPKGPLFSIARDPEHWHVVRINGDPENPNRSSRIGIEWARAEIKKYGRDNPYVKVAVLGEFPDVGFTNLLGPDDLERAEHRQYMDEQVMYAQKRIGVDVARFGDDATVISVRQGLRAGPFLELRKLDTQAVADRIALAVQRTGAELVFVDANGMGVGVIDALKRLRVRTVGVDSSSKPTDDRYFNKRAEVWTAMADWVKSGGGIPPAMDQLKRDLMEPTYSFKHGKILIEDKDQIKKRLGRSPDWGDSLAMTFAMQDRPASGDEQAGFIKAIPASAKGMSDFDPHRTIVSGGNYDPLDSSKL